MDECCAPQWTDFTSSPMLASDSYFEEEHEVHGPQTRLKSMKSNNTSSPCKGNIKVPMVIKLKDEPNSSLVKQSPAKVSRFRKKSMTKDVNEVLTKAMRRLRLSSQTNKTRDSLNHSKNAAEPIAIKTQPVTPSLKLPKTEPPRRSIRLAEKNKTVVLDDSKTNESHETLQENDVTLSAVKKENDETNLEIDGYPDNVEAEARKLSYKVITAQRRISNSFNVKRSLKLSQPRVLTCQYRRQSLIKYRRRSQQFVSMAEAIAKFQNATPDRFRTLNQKEFKPAALTRVKRSPLKLTYPVSPALRCKHRTRTRNVLTKEERETQELEEMKKYQIKAKPVNSNILKGPAALKKVPKKPATVAEEFRLTMSKKSHNTGACLNAKQPTESNKDHRKTMMPSTSASSLMTSNVKKLENLNATFNPRAITRAQPFTFEARNKEFQMKKEEKIKNLQNQVANKVKPEFHARPVPNFTKSATAQKVQTVKKASVPCPFSFEQRDKCMAKKKGELRKQLKEEDKKVRTFHANPAPTVKPVLVHGLSKETLKIKEKVVDGPKKDSTRHTKHFGDQENKQPNIITNTTHCIRKRETKSCMVGNETVTVTGKLGQMELSTMKRAKNRCEFEEKMKKKEQEDEMKRLEEEKLRLAKEKQERMELRKMTEVKARPMPVYKPLVLVKSNKPPTSPKSPAWTRKPKPENIS